MGKINFIFHISDFWVGRKKKTIFLSFCCSFEGLCLSTLSSNILYSRILNQNSSISFKCYSTIFCDKKCRKSIFIQFILILCVQFIFSYYFWYVYLTNNIIKILIGGKIENFINSPSVCEFSFSFLTSSQKRQHLLLNKINSKYVTCG